MFRLYFVTFTGKPRTHKAEHAHEVSWSMATTLIVLGTGSIVVGYVGLPIKSLNFWEHWLDPVFEHSAPYVHTAAQSHGLEWILMTISILAAGLGIWLAYMFYNGAWKEFPTAFTKRYPHLYKLIFNKYYVDEIYGFLVVKPLMFIRDVLHQVVDVGLIDGLMVNGSARATDLAGRAFRILANGDVQAYIAAFIVGAVALLLLFV